MRKKVIIKVIIICSQACKLQHCCVFKLRTSSTSSQVLIQPRRILFLTCFSRYSRRAKLVRLLYICRRFSPVSILVDYTEARSRRCQSLPVSFSRSDQSRSIYYVLAMYCTCTGNRLRDERANYLYENWCA